MRSSGEAQAAGTTTWQSSTRNLLTAVVLASAAVLIAATHAFVGIKLARVKAVPMSIGAVDGRVQAALKGAADLDNLNPPLALIVRLASSANARGTFTFRIDDELVCRHELEIRRSRRVDCAVGRWSPGQPHTLTVEGPPTSWALTYAELATHHGNTSGAHYFVVLPESSTRYERPKALNVAVLALVVLIGWLLPSPPRIPGVLRLLYRFVIGVIATLALAVECSNLLSNYRVVVSFDTLVRWAAILLAPQIVTMARAFGRPAPTGGRFKPAARAIVAAMLVVAAYASVTYDRLRDQYGGNYSGLLLIPRAFFDANPLFRGRDDVRRQLFLQSGSGYDGQFMYYATFDPFLRTFRDRPSMYRRVMDAAPYRYGRIGYSLLTRLISGDHWERYPQTMIWLLLGSLGILCFIGSMMAQAAGLSPAFGLLVLAVPGFWTSLESGLPEPLAAATLGAGLWCLSARKFAWASLMFAVSLLVRETGVVAVLCLLGAAAWRDDHRGAAVAAGIGAVAPALVWRLYVAWTLYPDWGIEALLSHPPDLGLPLRGFFDLWRVVAAGQYFANVPELSRAAVAYPLLLIGGLALAVAIAVAAPSGASVAAVVYGVIAVSLNFQWIWVHVGNGQRGTYELFLILAAAGLASASYPKPIRVASIVFWSCSLAYVFLFGYNAAAIRAALPTPI